jgi:hypothetical protein
LAAPAYADVYVGGYNVTNCTFSWEPGSTIQGTVSSQGCIDGFLFLVHNDHLVSHPRYAGSSSDSQLVNDGSFACWYYDEGGYGIDRTTVKVRQIDDTLTGGKTGDPASELVTQAIVSLCAGGGLHYYVPGT